MFKRFLSIILLVLLLRCALHASVIDSLNILLEKAKTVQQKCAILHRKADYVRATSYQKAMFYDMQMYKLARSTTDTSLICSATSSLGENYSDLSKIDSALYYFNMALDLATRSKNKREEGSVMIDLGGLYGQMNNGVKGEECYARAYEIFKQLNDTPELNHARIGLAEIKTLNKKYEEALKLFFEAYKAPGITHYDVCLILSNISDAYNEMGQAANAIRFAKKCYYVAHADGITQMEAIALENLGTGYYKLHKYDSAENLLKQSIVMARMATMPDQVQQAYSTLSDMYAAEGKTILALDWYKKSVEIRDSNVAKENANHIADLEEKYQNHEKEQKITILDREEKLQKAELSRQRILIYSVCAVVLILLITGIIGYRIYRRTKQLNNQLDVQKQELLKLNDVKDKLFSIISHDLRSPLASMNAMLTLLYDGELSDEALKKHSRLLSGVLQQNFQLLDNLLQWAASQMQGIEVRKKDIDITALVHENIQMIQDVLDKKGIKLSETMDSPLRVKADISMVRLVLRNLLNNAAKFTPEGGKITIHASVTDNMLRVAIADSGMGLDEGLKQSILSGMLHDSTPGTQNEKGFGLGLKLCKEFIEKNGGALFIDSAQGIGSTFSFTLPLAA